MNQGGKVPTAQQPLALWPVDAACPASPGLARVFSGQAQVILYTLLLRMRYGYDASANGLLVYTAADILHTGKPESVF